MHDMLFSSKQFALKASLSLKLDVAWPLICKATSCTQVSEPIVHLFGVMGLIPF